MKKIENVIPLDGYEILVTFSGGEKRIKDMKPYLEKGVFSKLKDKNFFNKVEVKYNSICWDDIDMCADTVYDTSIKYEE